MLKIGIAGLASYYSAYFANRADEHAATVVGAAAHLDASKRGLEQLGRKSPAEFGSTHDCPVFDSIEELVEADIDALVLGSLLSRRQSDALTALQSDIPILAGKPTADSADATRAIASLASERNVVMTTTTPHRYDGRIQEAKQRVDDGGIGDVLHVRASVFHARPRPAGIVHRVGLAPMDPGPVFTMGYYTSDLISWFIGDIEPATLSGTLANTNSPFLDHPDTGSAIVQFENGTLGTMTFALCNREGPRRGWEIEVIGTEGTIKTHHNGSEGTHWHSDKLEVFGRSFDPVLDLQFDRFVEAIQGNAGYDAVSPGPYEAAEAITLCDAWAETRSRNHPITVG